MVYIDLYLKQQKFPLLTPEDDPKLHKTTYALNMYQKVGFVFLGVFIAVTLVVLLFLLGWLDSKRAI